MLPVSTHLIPVVGLDLHLATSGNPFHPYIGLVIDPADYIPFLGSDVYTNGLKRGVSDTSGVLLTYNHIPLLGRILYDRPEPYTNLITWVYDGGSYTPVAKLTEEDSYTIVQDYLGTPIQALDSRGEVVWDCILDIYGDVLELRGKRDFILFRFQGQYEDGETGLYYNRFRYYDPNSGTFISQDPISILGGFNIYAYVHDVNSWVDVFGLSKYSPIEVLGRKVYQNSADFGGGVPTFVDPIVGKTNPTVQKLLDAGASNYDLMSKGYAPIGIDGKQINDITLSVLNQVRWLNYWTVLIKNIINHYTV
ncbi:MAG: hypothetical protein KHX29_05385 [Prevotella buccalis]|nr:hypothetical protein [Hoylesella buccalis]